MTAWKLSDFDTCHCGDYRHQHEGGVGRCKLGSLCTPTPCTKFRLVSVATEIPHSYHRDAEQNPSTSEDEKLAELYANSRPLPRPYNLSQQDWVREAARKITVKVMQERHAPGKGMSLPEWEAFVISALERSPPK